MSLGECKFSLLSSLLVAGKLVLPRAAKSRPESSQAEMMRRFKLVNKKDFKLPCCISIYH